MPVNRIDSVASKFFLFIVCLLVAKSKEPVKLEKFNIIDDTLTYFIIKKESSRAVSRVLYTPKSVSVIYLLHESPHGSSVLPSTA